MERQPGPVEPGPPPAPSPSRRDEWLIRHRAWVVMGVLVLALCVVALTGIGRRSSGGPSSAERPHVSFGATVQQPPALSTLTYTNGWVATAGASAIAVYAGSETLDRANGLIVVERSTSAGRQTRHSLTLRGAGAVTLLRPPPVQTMVAAEQATIHFVTANGETGSIALATDRVSLTG